MRRALVLVIAFGALAGPASADRFGNYSEQPLGFTAG
jgi:hypothetical protein